MASNSQTVLYSGEPGRPARKRGRGPGRPTRAEAEKRDRELLDCALDLFLERGFDGTTIEAIVDRLGMARRTVYAKYGDKETLFRAALQRAVDDWVVPGETLRAAEVEDLEETLLAVARLMVVNVRSPSGMRLARIANTEVYRMPELGAYLWERTAAVALDYLENLFSRRLLPERCSEKAAADAALAFLILTVEGSFQMKVWGDTSDEELDRQLAFRVRLFLDGARKAA